MKKIVHVANFNLLRLKGCFQVGFPVKISSGLVRNGYAVFNYPDRDLCRMFGFGHMNFIGKKKVNKHLIEYCKMIKPDVLLFGHADNITSETILAIREIFPELKVLQWNCDWIVPNFANRNIKALNSKKDVCDVTMISTGDKNLLSQFKTTDNKVAYIPNMADISIETGRSFEKEELPFDMMLVANTGERQFCGEDINLEKVVQKAEENNPDFKWLLAGLGGRKPLNGYQYLEAYEQAAMGFNISRLNDVYLYSSDRMAHIMANGQLAFTDRRSGFTDIFSEDEMAFYTTEEEFFDKLNFFKKNPKERMKLAKNGYNKIHSEFSDVSVTKYMMSLLFDDIKVDRKPWHILLK